MNNRVFVRDLFYGLKHTRHIWGFLSTCLFLAWLGLFAVEFLHQEPPPDLDLAPTLPVRISGEIPLIETKIAIPVTMDGIIVVQSRPVRKRGFWEEFWRCGEITGVATMTIGFGDVVPESLIGKCICVIQAFIGMVMLGVIVGVVSHAIGLQLQKLV